MLEESRLRLLSMRSAREVVNHILQIKEDNKLTVISFLWIWRDVRNKMNVEEVMLATEQVVHRTRCLVTILLDPSLNPREPTRSGLERDPDHPCI